MDISPLLPRPLPFPSPKAAAAANQYHHLHLLPTRTLHFSRPCRPQFSSPSRRDSDVPPPPSGTCPVPLDQQPINEYRNLTTSFPFSWAVADPVEYGSRLFVTGASFVLLVGLPVAWLGAPFPESEPLKRVLCAGSSGIFAVTLAVVRMYLGWAYVGNRLLSATVEYEETGWYDGQVWVKTTEILARDRLLGSYTVKPVLSKLKYTLVSLAASLCLCVVLLLNVDGITEKGSPYKATEKSIERAIPGVYDDESARSFEPDAFCGEPSSSV
ncbi:hypothetical protein MLD38_007008 [Melastoma candidum]|uniref:Uncharacterized protein n=1 Tax=Melastoma candidum TaxID=119954 RepID=A0ACB9RTH6_9MYRT|nr:hypothetical protein MLD38_007008 [Melastoma candidum]